LELAAEGIDLRPDEAGLQDHRNPAREVPNSRARFPSHPGSQFSSYWAIRLTISSVSSQGSSASW
jgi:hypothetical protein